MGEDKEKKKKKKKKESKEEEPPPPEPEPEKKKSSKKKSSKKRASGPKYSGALSIFSEKQLTEFKQGFNYMDQDKDGIITKADLFRTYDIVGKLVADAELDDMLSEAPNPITFTQMLSMFAERMQGKADDDELIVSSFKAFDEGDGSIEPDQFAAMMKGKGDPLTPAEVDEIFPQLPRLEEQPHPRYISLKGVIEMLVAPLDEEECTESEVEPVAA
jgi:Ca2+-binding EF-hand superfamily protein